ncbi:glycosyltransferase [Microbacterium sp. NPDC086615]|uniref:glycosyltransferase family 32 protein n=1 Tax=Microbacterium sp. NPDC086615 TaxID=3154865 RepID=UPI00341F929A
MHQIWLGGEPPSQVQEWMKSWKDTHPGWQYRLWTDAHISEALNQRQIHYADSYAAKADILRVDILAKYGGVYVDADYEAHRAIDPIVRNRSAVLLSEGPNLTNSFLAFSPAHPIVMALQEKIGQLSDEALTNAGNEVLSLTGPLALTSVVAADPSVLSDEAVCMIAPDYFLVPKSRNPDIQTMAQARRFATHHAAASWRTTSGISRALRSTRLKTRVRRFFDLSAS